MSESKNYYLVRSYRGIPLEDNVVGYGWGDVPFCNFKNAEEIINEIVNVKKWIVGRRSNQIRRFKSIKEGDVIVVPWWGSVAIGIATGDEKYDDKYNQHNGSNQQKVNFIQENGKVKLFPRTSFSEAFQKRLRIRITVADISGFSEEINKFLESKIDYLWANEFSEKSQELQIEIQKTLLDNIRKGKTHLKTGGIGLENLISELLKIEGFKTEILSKRLFPEFADADIKATKDNFFEESDYLIQVKHHDYNTGLWGQEQLIKIKDVMPDEYKNTQLVLITSGEISEESEKYAEKNNILTIDGQQISEWILNSIDKLSEKTKIDLGLANIPQLIS